MKSAVLSIFFVCLSFPFLLAQDTEVFEKTETYKIYGQSESELRESLNQASPCKENGTTFDAHTTWYVKWFFTWKYNDGVYKISTANSNVEIKFIMPEWSDKARAPKELQKKWENYYQALLSHEIGHRNIGVEAARAVVSAIKNVQPAINAQIIEKNANAAANRVLERYRTQEKEYDRETAHGTKTGAKFP